MTDNTPSSDIRLTDAPACHPKVFEAAFNTGRADVLAGVYEADAVFVPESGAEVRGDALHAANAEFLSLGLPITVRLRHCYTADDLALLIVDWTIDGTGPDGGHVRIEGTATDVARRGPDGLWRYVIDNPFGVALGTRPTGSV
ncbi:YybH family protein [Yinghuangia sp. YIM S10712]|uniref:YybH family protein n=1 Tax=Yinghuangia sp. YIM S10712 TaxID=3436930 RepID=UPI003F533CE6